MRNAWSTGAFGLRRTLELRHREFVPKKQKKSKNGRQKIRVAEIHLSKIAKLDRAEKCDSDAPAPELGPETEAPF